MDLIYESGDEESTPSKIQIGQITQSQRSLTYVFEASYSSEKEALSTIDGTKWSKWFINRCRTGKKVYYRCRLSRFQEKNQCASRFYLQYTMNNN